VDNNERKRAIKLAVKIMKKPKSKMHRPKHHFPAPVLSIAVFKILKIKLIFKNKK